MQVTIVPFLLAATVYIVINTTGKRFSVIVVSLGSIVAATFDSLFIPL